MRIEDILLPLMERALDTEFGISVRTNRAEAARGPFYKIRKEMAPHFDELTYRKLNDTEEVFYIVKKNGKGDDQAV